MHLKAVLYLWFKELFFSCSTEVVKCGARTYQSVEMHLDKNIIKLGGIQKAELLLENALYVVLQIVV